MDRFRDRRRAGVALAERLAAETLVDPVVLALPRGGVPVGLEVAQRLGAPLDLVMVRKIGVPSQPASRANKTPAGSHLMCLRYAIWSTPSSPRRAMRALVRAIEFSAGDTRLGSCHRVTGAVRIQPRAP